jgi:hypothetical protein
MAASTEEPEAERGEPGGAGREPPARRKTPVTIDLTANRGSDNAASPEFPAEDAPDTLEIGDEPPRDAGPGLEDRPPPASPWNFDNPNLIPLAAAALAGAIVAVVVGVALQSAGVVPSPEGRDARTALAQSSRLEGDMGALSASMRGAITEQQAISARLAGLETIARDLITTTEQLRSLDSLTAATEARLELIEQSLNALKTGGIAPVDDSRITALSAQVEQLSARLAELAEAPSRIDQQTSAAARGMAFASLRAAAERGEPFREELALLRLLGVDATTLADLDTAKDGVPSKAALAASFDTIADAVVAASAPASANASVLERIWDQARSLVSIRPVGPIAGSSPEAIVSRMRAALATGDLSAALGERAALPDTGKAASAAWAQQAEARIALDRALIGLERAIETAAATQ